MPTRESPRPRSRWMVGRLQAIAIVLSVVGCMLFVAGLRDVALGAGPHPPSARIELPPEAGELDANLVVEVRGEEEQPVGDALVQVFAIIDGRAHLAARARTDAGGRSRAARLPHGEIWLLVTKPEHERVTTRLVLDRGERQVALTLGRSHEFEVVTVDPSGRPIVGVPVRLYGADPLAFERTTGARGLARFDALGPPPYAVEIDAIGFERRLFAELDLDDSPLFVKLERLGSVEVVVVEAPASPDAPAKPAVGAQVTVAGSGLWPARRAVTDEHGRVTIAGLPRGYYQLRAELDELVSDPDVGLLLDRGQAETIEIVLQPGVFVTVKVTDGETEDAPPIRDADVALVEGGLSAFPLYGRTNEEGRTMLGPVAGIDATVSARAEGFVPRSAVPVEEGQTEVHVALSRGGVLFGRVVDSRDYPIEGASLEVFGIDHDGMPIAESSLHASFRDDHFAFALPGAIPLIPVGELGVMPVVPDIPSEHGPLLVPRPSGESPGWLSRPDGSFRLQPVPPGRVYLIARHPDYVETVTETVRLDVGKEIELRVVMREGGVLEGRVVEQDGTPVGGARVEMANLDSPDDRVTFSADDGTFAFAAVAEQVLLSVARPMAMEHVVARLRARVGPGERAEVEIVLPGERDPVVVRVSDDRGYPLDRVEVRLVSLDFASPYRATRYTDESGEAEFEAAAGLPVRVVLGRTGHAPLVAQIERAPRTLELAMERGLSVHGEIRDRSGPVEDAQVTLYTPTATRHARSDETGEFTIADLAAMDVRILVHKAGYVPHEDRVLVEGEPGRVVELEPIDLDLGGVARGVVVDATDEPVAGALVAVGRVPSYLPLGPLPLWIASSDSRGEFVLRDLEPGSVVLEAFVPSMGRAVSEPFEVRAEETIDDVRIAFELVAEPEEDVAGRATLAVTLAEQVEGGRVVVRFEHVPAGGEAERAGIEPGDHLLAVGGVRVRSIGQARRLLTGPASEDLVLTLGRDPDYEWLVRLNRERVRR